MVLVKHLKKIKNLSYLKPNTVNWTLNWDLQCSCPKFPELQKGYSRSVRLGSIKRKGKNKFALSHRDLCHHLRSTLVLILFDIFFCISCLRRIQFRQVVKVINGEARDCPAMPSVQLEDAPCSQQSVRLLSEANGTRACQSSRGQKGNPNRGLLEMRNDIWRARPPKGAVRPFPCLALLFKRRGSAGRKRRTGGVDTERTAPDSVERGSALAPRARRGQRLCLLHTLGLDNTRTSAIPPGVRHRRALHFPRTGGRRARSPAVDSAV